MGRLLNFLVLVLAIAGGVYQLYLKPILVTAGLWRDVESIGNKHCKAVKELQACEKIVLHQPTGVIYLACSTPSSRPFWTPAVGRLNASGASFNDYVATYDPATSRITRLNIKNFGSERGLSLHGMDVVPSSSNPSELFVYLINHRAPLDPNSAPHVGADSAVEIFKTAVGSDTLSHIRTVEDPVIVCPNDLVGYPDGESFYFTNDHGEKVGHLRELDILGRKTTSVGYCHVKEGCKHAITKMHGNNGIARAQNDTFYVLNSLGGAINILDRQADNSLVVAEVLPTDCGLDNASVDSDGVVWIAGFPDAFTLLFKHFANPSIPAPSSALRLSINTGTSSFYGKKYKLDKFSMFSLLVKERFYINEVVLGTAFGVIVGPYVANIYDPRSWGTESAFITREVTRIVLATGLFAIGVELPKSYMAKHAKSLFVMVVPTMAIGWVIVAGGKYAKKHVPVNLRQILSAESAANDGLAFPFLTISLYLTVDANSRIAVSHWVVIGWLCLLFSHLMKFSHRRGYIDRESYVAQYLALAIFIIGVVSTIGSDDLLAAFAAGSAISWDGEFNDHTEGEVFSSVIDLVLNCACFVYIGAWFPFQTFNAPELGIVPWRLVVLFISILVLRRIPAILVLYRWIPEIKSWREALFSGHFAIFIASLALHKLPTPQVPPQNEEELLAACLEPIVAFVVLGSIIIHGLSIPFFSLGKTTLSMTNNLTNKTPDWMIGIRHASIGNSSTAFGSPSPKAEKVEASGGMERGEGPPTAALSQDLAQEQQNYQLPTTRSPSHELARPQAAHFPAAQ
ncbi:hypothetical protein DXG03_000610 [Asterophora parasitica]|uniref:Cation/H+ exchanger transmembrane domain-containing protein n=1 Tax=Asterophora parasitica TaxID=117018 RepID=A0A9P7GAR5_9AGAR|nr:hypothetical protein DXG03_000610 [Asterophora parasitica]